MSKNDISTTTLEKLALNKDNNTTYKLMSIYYGLANINGKSMTTDDYRENLNEIIGDYKLCQN